MAKINLKYIKKKQRKAREHSRRRGKANRSQWLIRIKTYRNCIGLEGCVGSTIWKQILRLLEIYCNFKIGPNLFSHMTKKSLIITSQPYWDWQGPCCNDLWQYRRRRCETVLLYSTHVKTEQGDLQRKWRKEKGMTSAMKHILKILIILYFFNSFRTMLWHIPGKQCHYRIWQILSYVPVLTSLCCIGKVNHRQSFGCSASYLW